MGIFMGNHQNKVTEAIKLLKNNDSKISPRYERKLRINRNIEEILITRIYSIGFMEEYPSRRVNSIYFDTENLDFAIDNIEGNRDRLKIRTRWYGENNKHYLKCLEYKIKDGFLGYKYSKNYTENDINIEEYIQKSIRLNVGRKLYTFYNRSYFKNIFGIRITIDKNIHAYSKYLNKFTLLPFSVLEIKYGTSQDNFYRRSIHGPLTSGIPIRLNKSSKYVESLFAIGLLNNL